MPVGTNSRPVSGLTGRFSSGSVTNMARLRHIRGMIFVFHC